MTTYQHPLAYLLGLEGLALLRGWAGDFDRSFTEERLEEVRRLLEHPVLTAHPGAVVERGSTSEGYRQWAPTYDEPNGLFALDTPFVQEVLDQLPAGVALDAACGTGRMAQVLRSGGHEVVGVDSSPDMLARARQRVPRAHLVLGDLSRLPLRDDSVDVVVCALALSHVASLGPVMAEFARVLVPGGHLVVTDVHPDLILRGSVVASVGPQGQPGQVPTHRHSPGAFLRSALPRGFVVRRCEEPHGAPAEEPAATPSPPPLAGADLGEWRDWPWSLLELVPAARAAVWDIPLTINWHLQLDVDQ